MSTGWRQIADMVGLGAFERIAKLQPSRDLYMSFLVQGCALVHHIPTKFPAALAVSYRWLAEHDETIAPAIAEEYKVFFAAYKGHKARKG